MSILDVVRIEQATERLRQESETFDQRKSHQERWFKLRLSMEYASVVVLPAIAVGCALILFDNQDFPDAVVTAAAGALFADVLGLMLAVWRIVLNPGSITNLEPVTSDNLGSHDVDEPTGLVPEPPQPKLNEGAARHGLDVHALRMLEILSEPGQDSLREDDLAHRMKVHPEQVAISGDILWQLDLVVKIGLEIGGELT